MYQPDFFFHTQKRDLVAEELCLTSHTFKSDPGISIRDAFCTMCQQYLHADFFQIFKQNKIRTNYFINPRQTYAAKYIYTDTNREKLHAPH